MPIISRSELKGFQRHASFSELRNAQASVEKKRWTKAPSVFLSHSHLDESLVLSAISLLERYGGDVYVDWMDPGMPERTDAKTAQILREKIAGASRFIILASARALSSRWVPWELGYADAVKTLRNVAILPVREDNEGYPGNEYMQLYQSITMNSVEEPVVTFPGDQLGANLSYWLGPHWGKVIYGPPMPIRLDP